MFPTPENAENTMLSLQELEICGAGLENAIFGQNSVLEGKTGKIQLFKQCFPFKI